jgi:hypothetical protein
MQYYDYASLDDFIVGPSVEEFAPLTDEIESVQKKPESFWLFLASRSFGICFAACVAIASSLAHISSAVRWASQPRKQPVRQVHPGLGLEFTVFGLFVVCATMSLLI